MKRKIVKNKENFFSKKSIEQSLDYIKESRNYIYFAIVAFFLFASITFIFPNNFKFLDQFLEQILLKAEQKEGFGLLMFIFINNLSVAFYNIFLGFLLGIFPLINSVVNGGVLGYVFARVYENVGFFHLWRILPHGIFELPAIFIAIGLGVKNALFFVSKNEGEFKRRFFASFKAFIFIILPLLFVAAIIETLLITFAN
jgi:stage II sporulation protein M